MYNEHKTRTTRWQWLAILGIVAALLVTSPGQGTHGAAGTLGPVQHRRSRGAILGTLLLGAISLPLLPAGGRHAPARSMSNPPPRRLIRRLLPPLTGTIAKIPRVITRMSNSVLVAGNQSPRPRNRHRVCPGHTLW